MPRTLYICYFGVREPLVQTQVLPYLREIAGKDKGERIKEKGVEVSLLTFEPGNIVAELGSSGVSELKKGLAAEGIEWSWLPYHKRPSAIATAWDVFRGAWFIRRRLGRYDILHGRAHVAALMGALGRKFSRRRPKLLFDIRGFIPEEYTDAGIWPEGGLLYRVAKRVERWLMREADGFVVLTERAKEILSLSSLSGLSSPESEDAENPKSQIPNPKSVAVIPCCVDLETRFGGDRETLRREFRERLGVGERTVITHVGALGGLYLTDLLADLLAVAREREGGVFALFLTQSDPQLVEPLLNERGFEANEYFIAKVAPEDVEGYLYASDIGLSFVKATYATASRSPTKIPEYLACGLPIIANSGVGDVDDLIVGRGVGALVREFTPEGYALALDEVADLGDISDHCRRIAREEFDLEAVGGVLYRRIYADLLSKAPPAKV
jgi:glycosyltransferase involved in cell wall biosynthesis